VEDAGPAAAADAAAVAARRRRLDLKAEAESILVAADRKRCRDGARRRGLKSDPLRAELIRHHRADRRIPHQSLAARYAAVQEQLDELSIVAGGREQPVVAARAGLDRRRGRLFDEPVGLVP